MQEDFSKPQNIRDSLFGSFDLPEKSKIHKKGNAYEQKNSEQEESDELDFGEIALGEHSKIQQVATSKREEDKQTKEANQADAVVTRSNTEANSEELSKDSEKINPQPSQVLKKKPQQQFRKGAKQRQQHQKIHQKKVVNLDDEIGEVGEWAHRSDEQKSSDFDDQDDPNNRQRVQNDEMRKKIQAKVKMMENKSYGKSNKPMGLAAKAQELKKKNQEAAANQTKGDNESQQNLKLESSSTHLNVKKTEMPNLLNNCKKQELRQEESNEQEDPWEKVNAETLKKYNKKEEEKSNSQPLTKDQIITFYREKYQFSEDDIAVQLQEIEEADIPVGCWDSLFGCFKEDQKQTRKSNKTVIRLIAISKKAMQNTDEEFFILKYIWEELTGKKFARFGNHWNEIGFQGRDPATDLRSTGILSLLQWFQIICHQPKIAKQLFEWTSENDFPLALTHIKSTGLFLKMLKKNSLNGKSWNEYQKHYNCIVWTAFKRIEKKFKEEANIGELVDQNLQWVQKNYSSSLKDYEKIVSTNK